MVVWTRTWMRALVSTYASKSAASIGHAGVDASNSVFRVDKPPGLPLMSEHGGGGVSWWCDVPSANYRNAHCWGFVHTRHVGVEDCWVRSSEDVTLTYTRRGCGWMLRRLGQSARARCAWS